MPDPQLNNYIYQNLFSLAESLKADSSPENIKKCLALNKVYGNMIRQEAVDLGMHNSHMRSKQLPYTSEVFRASLDMRQLENNEESYNEEVENNDAPVDKNETAPKTAPEYHDPLGR